jgi:hypothetical protein
MTISERLGAEEMASLPSWGRPMKVFILIAMLSGCCALIAWYSDRIVYAQAFGLAAAFAIMLVLFSVWVMRVKQ